ncbi:MAG: pyridoxal-phosphate dependent enzyme, partial [Prevotella sp.]|nr:pyridoxal-phosphate dependent enzyme [Prevotella sp.]
FIAANNANDIFYNYLKNGRYEPKPSKQTIANAMDVGDPSNFARILDLYQGNHERISGLISGATYTDEEIRQTMRQCYGRTGYVLDPHGACGYQALKDGLQPGETGIFCETAHPAKFKQTVDETLAIDLPIPDRLAAFMKGQKQAVGLSARFDDFKAFLMQQ